MNLKKRLILSNTITITIPFVISVVMALVFYFILAGIFNRDVGYESFKQLAGIRAELFNTGSSILKEKPEVVEEKEFQRYLMQKVSGFNGEVVITIGGNTLFSTKDFNKIDIEKSIENSKDASNNIKINNISYFTEVIPLNFSNGVQGNVILLAPMNNQVKIIEKLIIAVVLIFIISFITVNIFMSYMLSKRILKPVAFLKNAAFEISGGNLDLEIIEDGDEEIRDLCRSFEQMRLQLKESIRAKMMYDDNRKMLVSSISHDLKTPITSIKGYVEGILDGVANTPEKLEEYLRTIYSKSEQIDSMIDDLLLYSKLDLKQVPYNFEKTDIAEYFSYCVAESTIELEKYNINIRLVNELKKSRYVMMDRERMRRVIMNIIDNSRKYMNKQSGGITIFLRETNLSIIVEIRDNGIGIHKDEVDRIFDRFYRVNAARGGVSGSGLGLAIAKQIVEGHRGRIWAVSHGNEGTSIIISLAKREGEL